MNWTEPVTINSDFISRDLGDEIVLMSRDGQEIHSFEDSGLWVWQCLLKDMTPDDILQKMLEEYQVSRERARSDLTAFFDDLMKKEIIGQIHG